MASNPGRQAEARAAHPNAQVISRDEWAGSRSDIDLVVVATPPASHGPLAAAAIKGGCAVVVDKPFALTSAEGEALLALAKEHGQILTTYQNRRWDGEYLTLTKLLAQGALGEVRRFESRLERWQPEITKEWKAQATAADGGGLLFDLGTHLIDQALQLFGPVGNVYGELAARRPMEQAEDDVFIALQARQRRDITPVGQRLRRSQRPPLPCAWFRSCLRKVRGGRSGEPDSGRHPARTVPAMALNPRAIGAVLGTRRKHNRRAHRARKFLPVLRAACRRHTRRRAGAGGSCGRHCRFADH